MVGKRKFPDVGDPNDPEGFLVMRERFLEGLRVAAYSPRSVETMGARLRSFFVWCDERGLKRPSEVTREHLERFQQWLFHYRKSDGNPLDFDTQKLDIGAFKLFFKWLSKHGHIPFNPASEIEYPKSGVKLPKAVMNHDEVERVLSLPDLTTPMGLRDRAVLETLYSSGLRRMELEGVLVSDVDFSHGTLFVRKGKGNKERVVPIGARALAWVRKYLEDARPSFVVEPTVQALFLDREGRPLSKRALTWLGNKYVQAANLGKKGSVHVFRHSMATEMLDGGADIRFIQAMLGHASLKSTQVYTKVAIGALKAVHTATHPAAKLEPKVKVAPDSTKEGEPK